MAGRRIADVLATDNMRDALVDVVDADGELVGPLAFAVADGEVSALEFRVFGKVAQPQIMPYDYFIWNDESEIMRRVGVPLSSLVSP